MAFRGHCDGVKTMIIARSTQPQNFQCLCGQSSQKSATGYDRACRLLMYVRVLVSGTEARMCNVNVNNLLAISKSDFDNSGEPGPQAECVHATEATAEGGAVQRGRPQLQPCLTKYYWAVTDSKVLQLNGCMVHGSSWHTPPTKSFGLPSPLVPTSKARKELPGPWRTLFVTHTNPSICMRARRPALT